MSIINVLDRARREPPMASRDGLFPDQRYVCEVLPPVPWDRHEIERVLGFEIPPDLAMLWDSCGGLMLYEDNKFHVWGLVVVAPTSPELFNLNNKYHKAWGDSVLPGDLIFGRFKGDGERPLIRCDKSAHDYGSIFIVAEMDPRPQWYKAAASLEEFLIRFMDAHGEKYWEYHYKKELADRAVEDLLRSRWEN